MAAISWRPCGSPGKFAGSGTAPPMGALRVVVSERYAARVPEDVPAALAERIGQFCRQYARNDQLAELMAEAGADDVLAAAVAVATSDTAGPDEITRALDAVELVLAGLGIHSLTGTNRE